MPTLAGKLLFHLPLKILKEFGDNYVINFA